MKKIYMLTIAAMLSFGAMAQNVNIPNANFKYYLVNNININTNNDSEIQVGEAQAYTSVINCGGLSITDLTGIEAFTNITQLYCYNNQLTNINLSNNTALVHFSCSDNQLTSLDVSNNPALQSLFLNNNQVTSLDISQNTALTVLGCANNQLTSLNVSNNTALTVIRCGQNQLTNLDVGNNTSLTELKCNNNNLNSLNLSANSNLSTLDCTYNNLTSLDVNNNTSLTLLYCYFNNFMALDVSNNTALTELHCGYNNSLVSLNVANGNNTNFTLCSSSSCPNLTCIQVDDVAYSTANWTGVNFQFDAGSSFSENCSGATGIFETTPKKSLNIYPNPAKGVLNIETIEAMDIQIVNFIGETILSTELNHQNNNVDVSSLTNGVYFILNEKGGATKFIKE